MDKVFVVSRSKLLRKGGPYVGPRGGLWADPKHTVHWEPTTAQPHDFGHVEAEQVDAKVEEVSKLSLDELKAMQRRNDQLKVQSSKAKQGVPLDVLRWGRIIDKAIAKYPPKMVAAVATPPAEAQAEKQATKKPEQLGLILTPMPEKPVAPAIPPPAPTEVIDDFAKTVEKKIAEEAKPEPKKRAPRKSKGPQKLEATGDHIWGSRVDLARLEGGFTNSKQLEGVNYDDAVKLVTKKHLVPAHSLETLKAAGMTPGTAHMVLAMTAAIGAKPGDTTAERAAYVDEVHSVLGAMLNCKTLDDFSVLRRELAQRQYQSKKYEVVQTLKAPTDMGQAQEAIKALEKDHPGTSFYSQGARYASGGADIQIVKDALRPLDALGSRFIAFVSSRDSTLHNDAYSEAMTADGEWGYSATSKDEQFAKLGVKDGWEYLEKRGSAAADVAKAKKERSDRLKEKSGAKTERGWSGAKDVAGEIERKNPKVEVKDANPKRVKDTFNLKEVDYGQEGYMTQADREYHTKALEGALHDLSEILGIPTAAVSLKGRLGIAMGARGRGGKAAAHYEPGRYVINLTKFAGGGSLAHEWGHALDNIIAHVYRGDAEKGQYLSGAPDASFWPAELKAAYKKVREAMHKHPDPLKARNDHNEHVAKLRIASNELVSKNNGLVREHATIKKKVDPDRVEKAIGIKESNIKTWRNELKELKAKETAKPSRSSFGGGRHSDIVNREFWIEKQQKEIAGLKSGANVMTEADTKRLSEISDEVEMLRPQINKARDAVKTMENLDPTVSDYHRSAAILGDYWSAPHEMFARSFESYVHDKLKKNGRSNTYLSAGTGKYPTDMPLPSGESVQPYPQGPERDNIYKAIDEFVAVLSNMDQFQKAFRESLPFTRFVIPAQL